MDETCACGHGRARHGVTCCYVHKCGCAGFHLPDALDQLDRAVDKASRPASITGHRKPAWVGMTAAQRRAYIRAKLAEKRMLSSATVG
jgi:hypothetical protein